MPRPAVSAEVGVAGGHDTNMLLRLEPDGAMGVVPVSGLYAGVAPALSATVPLSSWRLGASYAADYRRAEGAGHLFFQEAAVEVTPPEIGPVRVRAAASAGSFTTSGALGFALAAATLGTRIELTEAVRVHASARYEARAEEGGERWWIADARVPVRPRSTWQVGPFASLVRIAAANDGDVTYRRWRLGMEAAAVWGRLTTQVAGHLGSIAAEAPARREVGAGLDVRVRVTDEIDLFGSAQVSRVAPGEQDGPDLSRRIAVVGVSLHLTTKPSVVREPAADAPDAVGPVVAAGRVRFRHRAPSARAVGVVGSWND